MSAAANHNLANSNSVNSNSLLTQTQNNLLFPLKFFLVIYYRLSGTPAISNCFLFPLGVRVSGVLLNSRAHTNCVQPATLLNLTAKFIEPVN